MTPIAAFCLNSTVLGGAKDKEREKLFGCDWRSCIGVTSTGGDEEGVWNHSEAAQET